MCFILQTMQLHLAILAAVITVGRTLVLLPQHWWFTEIVLLMIGTLPYNCYHRWGFDMKICFGHKHFRMILHQAVVFYLSLFSCGTIVIAGFHIIVTGYSQSAVTAALGCVYIDNQAGTLDGEFYYFTVTFNNGPTPNIFI